MKITAFNGSVKGVSANTNLLIEEFLKGAEDVGAKTENIILKDFDIKSCRGCFKCWLETPGKCIINDDMGELLEKFKESDAAVLASPLYIDNVSAILKLFLDRLVPLLTPYFEINEKDEYYHPIRYENPPSFVVISNSGFPEASQFQVLELLFQRMARNFSTQVTGEIYRGAGEILRSNHPDIKNIISEYKKLLQRAGTELVNEGKILKETENELKKPLIPHNEYIKLANKYWDKKLNKE